MDEQTASTGIGSWWTRRFGGTVIPVVRLQGVIAADQRPGRINIATFGPVLRKAFSVRKAPAVAIIVNSPGGSPVQSRLVSKLIRDLADENHKEVLVFVEDAAASGGYFIAVAGDEIIADPSSIVGSVGVIMATFGFEEAIKKLGVTRRLYTAGKNKSTLDPFLPEKKADVDRIKAYESDIHEVFIEHVRARRGSKLKGKDDVLFTGEFWTAKRGLELGLIDTIGDIHSVLRQRYGKNARLRLFGPKRPLLQLPRFGLAGAAGSLPADTLAAIEDRAIWSRFGL